MSTKLKKLKRFAFYASVIFFTVISASTFFIIHAQTNSSEINSKLSILYPLKSEFTPLIETEIIVKKLEEEKILQDKKKDFDLKVKKANESLAKYNSPFTGLGEIIVSKAEECNGDYKILMAIAGNESGFGRIPYKKYNPFGYLSEVQYSSWEEALSILSCKISQQYIVPCNSNLSCIIATYGGHDTDKQQWMKNIQWFINQL